MSTRKLEDEVLNIRQQVIQTIAENMDLFLLMPSVGRLYGTMYFHDQPMTLDEMCEELQMSKASMSTGVRALQEIQMVHKTWEKGVRKDLYLPETDWYQTFIELFSIKWRKALEMNLKAMGEAEQQLNNILESNKNDTCIKEIIQADLEKIKHAKEYYDWLSRFVEALATGEIFNFIPKKPVK